MKQARKISTTCLEIASRGDSLGDLIALEQDKLIDRDEDHGENDDTIFKVKLSLEHINGG